MKKIIFILGIVFSLSACGDSEPAVKVTYSSEYINEYVTQTKVKVSSIVDDVIVESVILNRGNCDKQHSQKLPINLKFGESFLVFTTTRCELAQIDVVTNKGSWTINY
jgi:uncharacterized lipoprotein YehR (DUF1307 family)